MRKIILLLTLLTLTANVFADNQMVVGGRDGQVILSQDLSTLQKLTFTAQSMLVHTTDGQITEVALEGLGIITFTDVEGISITQDDMSNLSGKTCVYTLDGRLVTTVEHWSEELFRSLASGTYAVRIGEKTIKVIKEKN